MVHSPPRDDAPQDPPTLRPMTTEPRTPSHPIKRLKLNSESSDTPVTPPVITKNCTKEEESPQATPPPQNAGPGLVNGVSSPETPTPPRVTLGVGRRTSVLFKKAKNGAKLQKDKEREKEKEKEKDNQLQNGGADSINPPNCLPTSPVVNSTPAPPTQTPTAPPPPPSPQKQRPPSRGSSPERHRETSPHRTPEAGQCSVLTLTTH